MYSFNSFMFKCHFSKLEHIAHYKTKNQNTVKTHLCMSTRTQSPHTQSTEQDYGIAWTTAEEVRFQSWFERCESDSECVWWPNFTKQAVPTSDIEAYL